MLRERMPVRSYHGEIFHTNTTNKKHLAIDFNHRCAYCDDSDAYGGGLTAYHVEHFAPKTKFPSLEFDYDNLLYACPWCNRAKWDTWPSNDPKVSFVDDIGFVDPCTKEFDQHLDRLPDGSIRGLTPLGKSMYETLHLYLKRHAIIHNLDKLQIKVEELRESIAADKADGSDCRKKEEALNIVMNDFFNYFNLWKENSQKPKN